MSREKSFLRILQASAKFQRNVYLILEYKANEAEKARKWICNHLNSSAYENHAHQVRETMAVHQQVIEVLDGLTQMEAALAKNLEIVLGAGQSSNGLGGPDAGGGAMGMDLPMGGGLG